MVMHGDGDRRRTAFLESHPSWRAPNADYLLLSVCRYESPVPGTDQPDLVLEPGIVLICLAATVAAFHSVQARAMQVP